MVSNWWEKPVQTIRVDYSPDFWQVKEEDMASMARQRREEWGANCEWIIGSIDFPGPNGQQVGAQITFNAEGFDKAPGFGNFDFLRSYIPHAHAEGMKVIAYLDMHWFSYEFAAQHPEWQQLTRDGEVFGEKNPLYGDGTTFCVNSAWRDWAFRLIAEAGRTGVDGVFLDGPSFFPDCCYCEACQERFRELHGEPLPVVMGGSLWKKFLQFRNNSYTDFLDNAGKSLKAVNKDAGIFLNAGGWSGSWRTARNIQQAGDYQDFNGVEAFFHYGVEKNIYKSLMTGKFLRAGGKPAVVFTHHMNGVWHYLNLPDGQIMLALAQAAAANVNPWIAIMNSSMESQPESNLEIRKMYNFLENNEAVYSDTETVAETAVLFSACTDMNYMSSHDEFFTGGDVAKEEDFFISGSECKALDWMGRKKLCMELMDSAYLGYFKALTRNHIAFDIIWDCDLDVKKLSKYKSVILPDAACLNSENRIALKNYVAGGGRLLASFEAGFYDENGEPVDDLFELLGIEKCEGLFPVIMKENYVKNVEENLGFAKNTLAERGAYVLKVNAREKTKCPAYFMNPLARVYVPLRGVSKYPAVMNSVYGKGRVSYFPEAIGHFFEKTGMISSEQRIVNTIKEFNSPAVIETNAPRTVSIELYHQKVERRYVAHLVNNTVDHQPINEFIPVRNIELKLRLKHKAQKVSPLREKQKLEMLLGPTPEELTIRIPVLDIYEAIVIEY